MPFHKHPKQALVARAQAKRVRDEVAQIAEDSQRQIERSRALLQKPIDPFGFDPPRDET